MANNFKISIPKPCNESWDKMTPSEKGRFCSSCSKTVIDFTSKTRSEIKQELQARKNEKLCGHFYKKQLDGLVIQIPEETFQKQLSYSKLFLLVLLLTMGTTLLSCTSQNGEKQKIENVVVEKKICGGLKVSDTFGFDFSNTPVSDLKEIIDDNYIEGEFIITGNIEHEVSDDNYDNRPIPFVILDSVPRFKESVLSTEENAKLVFQDSISEFIKNQFNYYPKENKYDLKGLQRAYLYFEINEKGVVENIKVRTKNNDLKNYIIEITKKLPQFEPGVRNGKPVSVSYTLPIMYRIN